MQKIMFNDRYGLTDAVLRGDKIMTRRIIQEIEIDWNRRGRVTLPVGGFENGTLLMDVRSILSDADISDYPAPDKYQPKYKVGEEIAIAQKYWDLRNCDAFYDALQKADPTFPLECIQDEKGCHNKMFVKASWMPHRIRITNINVERLQDISDMDCLCEGVYFYDCGIYSGYTTKGLGYKFPTARDAFAALIDKISGKGTWNSNPWVFAYTFELVR